MRTRKLNTFEKILMFIGLIVIVIGFGLILSKYTVSAEGITWDFLQTIFLWLIVVMLVIFLAVLENLKEELFDLIQLHQKGKALKTPKKKKK